MASKISRTLVLFLPVFTFVFLNHKTDCDNLVITCARKTSRLSHGGITELFSLLLLKVIESNGC